MYNTKEQTSHGGNNNNVVVVKKNRGRIPGRNWDSSLMSFPPCYSQSPSTNGFYHPPLIKSGLKLVCNVNIVYGNLKSENSQDYAQKPQRNCTFINSASGAKV